MKKAISIMLAVILSVSQLTLCVSASSNNPLKQTDRITQQLAETSARKQEIENSLIQRENMKDAALQYGATSSDTNNLGFILNRKTMTKREYEAFKWSFILSQFAIPLEDSLLDVFSQEFFNSMIEANIDIDAVQNFLERGGASPEEFPITASMLQDTNFNEVVDTIKKNYSLLYLCREDDSAVSLADVLYGGFAINERLYIYDTLLSPDGDSTIDDINNLYYHQDRLADVSSLPSYKIDNIKIPVAIYDASFYFFLQLAVGTYCLRNSTSVLELESIYGQAPLLIDSYGNICIYTSEGAKILMPNFGNSVFINTIQELDSEITDGTTICINQIELYNKWVTTLYTRTQRPTPDVFGGFNPVALGASGRLIQYATELPYKDDSDNLSNTIMLIDPADILLTDGFITTHIDKLLVAMYDDTDIKSAFSPIHNGDSFRESEVTDDSSGTDRSEVTDDSSSTDYSGVMSITDPLLYFKIKHDFDDIEYPFENRSQNIYTHIGETLSSHHGMDIVEQYDTSAYSSWGEILLYGTHVVYMAPLMHKLFGKVQDTSESLDDWRYNNYTGTIYSNYSSYKESKNFVHSLNTSTDESFINPYPILNTGINLASLDSSGNSGKTHYYKYAMSLANGRWRFATWDDEGKYKEVTLHSSRYGNATNSSKELLDGINSSLVMVTTFSDKQLINDPRFCSIRASSCEEGRNLTEIYLPISIINVGQNCNAFMGEEKGMFVTKHTDYFASNMKAFGELLKSYLADIIASATNPSGKDVRKNKLNFSVEMPNRSPDNPGHIELQSSDNQVSTVHWKGKTPETTYNSGFIVALPTPSKNNVKSGYIDCYWTGTLDSVDTNLTVDKDSDLKYYLCFDDLADYLDSIYIALGKSEGELYFSNALCTGDQPLYQFDGEETLKIEDDTHTKSGNMREAYRGIKLVINKSKNNYELNFTYYNSNSEESGTSSHTITYKAIDVVTGKDEKDKDIKETEYYWTYGGYKGKEKDATLNSGTDAENNILYRITSDSKEAQDQEYEGLVNAMNFIAMCGEAKQELEGSDLGTISNFKSILNSICSKWGYDSNDFLYAMSMLQHGVIEDSVDDAVSNIYFFDEYQYLLRNNEVDSRPGCNNSMDFAAITYYWDRVYLPDLTFNKTLTDHVITQTGIKHDTSDSYFGASNTAYYYWCKYETFLLEKNLTTSQYSFKKYLEEYTKPDEKIPPFTYEFILQPKSFSEYLEKGDEMINYFASNTKVYSYLEPDTIILYPVLPDANIDLFTFSGTADYVALFGTGNNEAALSSGCYTGYNPLRLIMALQCNTDYEHNYLDVQPAKVPEVKHISKEELMDKANEFFDNPVSSLSYILAGFLYKAHTTIATGSLGSVFSATWLVESKVYKWIMDRYIAIVTIIIVALLIIKLTQFAMSKTHNYMIIIRSIAGIMAMCVVPLVVFNGFIWAFDKSSQWALAGPINKMLLSEVNASVANRINNDPGVTAEFNAFREQFSSIDGEYDGLTFEEIKDYSLDGPVYIQHPLSHYTENLQFTTDKKTWYNSNGYVPVNVEHYQESMFYYFYDYIRSEFFNYVDSQTDGSFPTSTYLTVIETNTLGLDAAKYSDTWEDAVRKISSAEKSIATQTGEFTQMLNDTNFVYSLSINSQLADRYGGAYPKDLAGVYNLFATEVNKGGYISPTDASTMSDVYRAFSSSPWRTAMNDAKIIKYEDGLNPKLWTDSIVIADFCEKEQFNGNFRKGITVGSNTVYPIITSKLDLFNSSINSDADMVDLRANQLVLTPFEEKLCKITTEIYEDTLKALEYHSGEIKNEAAIQLMAWIATFRVSEAFGLEPSSPIPQTVTLDTVIRTAFIRDLDVIGSNSNTMYSLVAQGDSIGKLLLVLILETAIAIAGVLRIFVILYITGASFVILALRLLHKAPATTDLVYGIVGNVLALLVLHMLTLFLVVVAVEWVANATSNIPGLVLDIAMIAFVILMSIFSFRLVANLVKDAINLGGAKIKAGVHSMIGKISNMIMHNAGINALASELSSNNVEMTANNVAQDITVQEQQEEQLQNRRNRIEATIASMNEVEAKLAVEEKEQERRVASHTNQLASAELQSADLTNSAIQAAASGEISEDLVKGAASVAATSYGGPMAGAIAGAALNSKQGQKLVNTATKIANKTFPK